MTKIVMLMHRKSRFKLFKIFIPAAPMFLSNRVEEMRLKKLFQLTIALILILAGSAQAARVALVIGNRDYAAGPLKNPINDAEAMSGALAGLGFKSTLVKNLKRDDIGRTIERFVSSIKAGDDVLVFYAGHGVQVKGVNYLPAVDANIRVESDVALNSLNLNQLLERLDEAKSGVRLLLIDACRDNPYNSSFRSGARGLARVESAPSGTLMHFATRPGGVAADGIGSNGLYTNELLKHLKTPGLSVESMLKRVAAGVRQASGGEQQPWTEGALDGEFYFAQSDPVQIGAAVQLASIRPEPLAPDLKSDLIKPNGFPVSGPQKIEPSQINISTFPNGETKFQWPSTGPLIGGFDASKNLGLDIGGEAGDPVHAAADGRVVYAGSGLRGYGNLIILKHDNIFLTAYANNQTLLVKPDEQIVRGQKIAEMGSSESDRVKLHFEIRRNGKPIDPSEYLPKR